MSLFTDMLHDVIAKLPFHSETLVNDAHAAVDKVEGDVVSTVEASVLPKVESMLAELESKVISAIESEAVKFGATPTQTAVPNNPPTVNTPESSD